MIAVAFVAPSFITVFVIHATSIVFQLVTYKFVWQNIVETEPIEESENPVDLLEEFSLWWFPFFILSTGFFILIQKRELSQFFLY